MRYLVVLALLAGFVKATTAGELDKELNTTTPRTASIPTASASELDQESFQQAWHRCGFWAPIRPWGFGFATPVSFYRPLFFPTFSPVVSFRYGWGWNTFGGFYASSWAGFGPFSPAWGFRYW